MKQSRYAAHWAETQTDQRKAPCPAALADQPTFVVEQSEVVEQLAAGMAHHLNNIFQSILGYAELASVKADEAETLQKNLAQIVEQTQEGAAIIRQLLDYSGQALTEPQFVDLAPVVRETAAELKQKLPANIALAVDIQDNPDHFQAKADTPQIKRVLHNLGQNASDAMPDGGDIKLEFALFELKPIDQPPCPQMTVGPYIRLSVSDAGHGIEPEVITHIFDPFFTTQEIGQGVGLGLTQVYGIIKQHHGFIKVTSQPDVGTTISIYLPAQTALEKQRPDRKQAVSESSSPLFLLKQAA
jgi:signal transduction histidine kinase